MRFSVTGLVAMTVLAAGIFVFAAPAHAAAELKDYLGSARPGEFFADADRFGPAEGSPPIVPVFSGERLRGYLYLNTDFANATGYSGKPISLLVGIDINGVISGIKLVDHKEPIVLIGIPVQRIIATMNSLIGRDIRPIATGAENPPQVDIVSGATVTVLVMADSVVRSAVRLIRSGRVAGGSVAGGGTGASLPQKAIDFAKSDIRDWNDLLGDGSVRRLHLSIGEVSDAFAKAGNKTAAENPEPGTKDDVFIDLYAALVTVPTIGRSLLGNEGYDRLMAQLKPGQQAILIAGDGAYSFKGSGYVRGGIFDRIELLQDGSSTRFRDRNHTRLGGLAAQGAPVLREVSLFVVPNELTLDPAAPWQIQLLVQRATATREKAFQTFELGYALPDTYLKQERPAPSPPPEASAVSPGTQAAPAGDLLEDPLWMRIWRGNVAAIGLTAFTLLALTAIFFFQDALVRRPTVYEWVRRAFLLFILVWLGWYANAQLSVVNVVTFTSALITGFKWEFFLASPLTFILWSAVAVGLLFWGRGPFCGWLCPFGALQELLSTVAKWLKVPQVTVPWGLHERLWPIKYILFIGLFGLSLYSVALTEALAEVEPFKTAIILKFAREWPYVVYALTLLCAGLFIERFFCRYLCPLGAALAIPGRMRTFEWLKRWSECGSPCQRCAKECPVQSIHPEGHINVNECIYCMHCQMLYHDDHRCPHMIQVRLKRERFEALSSPSMLSAGKAKPAMTHNGRPIDRHATVDMPLPPTP